MTQNLAHDFADRQRAPGAPGARRPAALQGPLADAGGYLTHALVDDGPALSSTAGGRRALSAMTASRDAMARAAERAARFDAATLAAGRRGLAAWGALDAALSRGEAISREELWSLAAAIGEIQVLTEERAK